MGRFAMIGNGNSKAQLELFGWVILSSSFVLMAFFFGWKNLLGLVCIFWFITTPAVEILAPRALESLRKM